MSPRRCYVPNCTVTQKDGVPLHRFPNPTKPEEIKRFRTWVINIGGDIVGEDNLSIFTKRRVCHRHFEEIYTFPNHRLTSLAIPTLHLSGVHVTQPTVAVQAPVPVASTSTASQSATVIRHGVHVTQPTVAVQAPVPVASTSTASQSATVIRHVSRPMTETERELRRNLAVTKAKLRKTQNAKNSFKIRLAFANKIMNTSAIEVAMKKMSPAAQAFFRMQISQFGKLPRGRRFTLDDKIWALSMYKPNPKSYRLLGNFCLLPKRKTLDKVLHKVQLLPGISDILFEHLKKRVDKMRNHHKICTIVFDEMAIAPHVAFDKTNDVIHGFVDNGIQRQQTFSDHVLVFMVRGVIKKFKQPVAYTFCTGTTKTADLARQIKVTIQKVMATGLNVIATVCDQGSTNMAALNYLMKETKATYLRSNTYYRGGFFEMEGRQIYPIYDPPHIMKGIRNNLITKDLEYAMGGTRRIAKWAHLDALYRRGPAYRGVRLVHKLTAQHVVPSLIPKMRVKFCTQVFSQNVGVTMGYMAGIGKLPKESKDTADLLLFFDKLFDSVNGNFSQPVKGKMYRCAVTPRSPHHKLCLWYRSLPILKSMKYVSKTGKKGTVPSITSWIKSVEAFQAITKHLHSQGLNSLLLRHFNQDPLENFFGSIRAYGLRNTMPTSSSFITSYKSLLLSNLTSPHSVGANCEDDESYCLNSLRFFLTENIAPTRQVLQTVHNDHLDIPQVNTDNLIANDKEKSAAIAYYSGWLVSKMKNIYKQCEKCRCDMESSNIEEFHNFIKIKEYRQDKTWLCYPTRKVFDYFCQIENIVLKILQSLCHISMIFEYIETIVLVNLNSSFITCTQHKEKISKIILNKSILFLLIIGAKI